MPAQLHMKQEVNYKVLPPEQRKVCDECEFWDYSRCQLVAGRIDRNGTCDKFSPRNPEKTGAQELASCTPCID